MDDLRETPRRFVTLFSRDEWRRIERRLAELRALDSRATYTDVVRELARRLPAAD